MAEVFGVVQLVGTVALAFLIWFVKEHVSKRVAAQAAEYGKLDAKVDRLYDLVNIEIAVKRGESGVQETARAYADYLKALAAIGTATTYKNDALAIEGHQLILDVKSRIAIYGDERVVHASAELSRAGGEIKSCDQKKSLIEVVQAMRKHTSAGSVCDNDVSQLILLQDLEHPSANTPE